MISNPKPICSIVIAARICAVLSVAIAAVVSTRSSSAEELTEKHASNLTADAERLFHERILPLFKEKCLACHGDDPTRLKGGLDIRTRDGLLKGGESGAALVPGNPAASRLFLAITRSDPDLQMPPKENDRLADEEIELFRRWIAGGAHWPDDADSKAALDWAGNGADSGVTVRTSGGLSPDWTHRRYDAADIWAFQPVRRPGIPVVASGSQPQNPIDAFIQEKLDARSLSAAPRADHLTLLRRATFDLTGLPPTPEQISKFLNDPSTNAFQRLVDGLLASPHYGEQWAQHWLDVVRYADTSGFSNDYERPNAWRYRDYVIRSFNSDKPFDRFIVEQLAGDELDPTDPELLIAAGFLRTGPWEHTGMSVAAVTRQQYLDDVTHHVGVTFLAQGLRCAACHDHKFDPVPTRDYYRMQAVFAPVQFADRDVPFQPWEALGDFDEPRRRSAEMLQQTRAALAELKIKSDHAIAAYLKENGLKNLNDLPPDERPKRGLHGLTKLELSLRKMYEKRADYYERELKRFEPFAFSVYAGPFTERRSNQLLHRLPPPDKRNGEVQPVHILTGGSIESPGDPVEPGVLSAMAGWNDLDAPVIPSTMEGRRLALARWISNSNNTLTARVIVNRVWQHHFSGNGIVRTPNNFGKMGARPTHPELLDWLAVWFVENGWSIKKLHRLIMASAAYQRATAHPEIERVRMVDPNNHLLACYPPRRLSAEEIRDSMLFVSGELNSQMGGPGVFPEIHWDVALQPRHIMGSVAPAYLPSPRPEQRNRRTIYAFKYRTLADPMLEVFNRPGTETSCERRDETTVTPQVFALFNGQFVHDRALVFADRLVRSEPDPERRVEVAYATVYARVPSESEVTRALEHVSQALVRHKDHRPVHVTPPTRVERKMIEEQTGEEFRFEEELPLMREYESDTKPWQVCAETRAWAELCLVLLNSNEFLYVR